MHLLNNVAQCIRFGKFFSLGGVVTGQGFGLCLSSETLGNCRFFSYIHYSIVDLSVVFMSPERATHDVRTDSLMHSSCRGCTLHHGASKYLQVSKDGLYEVVWQRPLSSCLRNYKEFFILFHHTVCVRERGGGERGGGDREREKERESLLREIQNPKGNYENNFRGFVSLKPSPPGCWTDTA